MQGYINFQGDYYEGDRSGQDALVPKRPSPFHKWDGSTWVPLPATIPPQVTMRQARLALLEVDKLSEVIAALAALPGKAGEAARIEWEFSSVVERHRPLVAALAAGLSLTDAELDSLFLRAAEL